MPAGRPTRTPSRSRFGKTRVELHLRNRLDILEGLMTKQHGFAPRRDRKDTQLPEPCPTPLAILYGRWYSTIELLQDFIEDPTS